MTAPEAAQRLAENIARSGAGRLLGLLIEYPGAPLPKAPELASEAAALEDWMVLLDTDAGWALPLDLAVAMKETAQRERFFLASMLGRLDDDSFLALRDELEVAALGSKVAQTVRLRRCILSEPQAGLDDQTAVANTTAVQSLATADILRVEAVPNTGGRLFDVEVRDASSARDDREVKTRSLRITCREFVAEAEQAFEPPAIPRHTSPDFAMSELEVPEWAPTGGLITFVTVRALEAALKAPEFTKLISERIGERRVTLAPGYSIQEAHLVLTVLGYDPSLAD